MDPIAFRLQNIATARPAAGAGVTWHVLAGAKTAELEAEGRGLGSSRPGTSSPAAGSRSAASPARRSAIVADITVNKKTGKITVEPPLRRPGPGLAVNPAWSRTRCPAASIQGLSRGSLEQVTFNKSHVTSLDWVTYPILRFADAPPVTNRRAPATRPAPTGSGEPPEQPRCRRAVANAFFDATGVRIREAPMTPGRVRATLKAAG